MNANGVLAFAVLPVVPATVRAGVRRGRGQGARARLRAGLQRLARPVWCGTHPGRFIPLGLVPFWDIDLTVAEIERLAEHGRARHLVLGEPVEARASRASTPITGIRSGRRARTSRSSRACTSGRRRRSRSPHPTRRSTSPPRLQPMNIVAAAADLVWSPVLRKFPTLKIALSEGGVGWLPYFLDKIDLVYRKQSAWTAPGLRRPAPERRVQGPHRHLLPRRSGHPGRGGAGRHRAT